MRGQPKNSDGTEVRAMVFDESDETKLVDGKSNKIIEHEQQQQQEQSQQQQKQQEQEHKDGAHHIKMDTPKTNSTNGILNGSGKKSETLNGNKQPLSNQMFIDNEQQQQSSILTTASSKQQSDANTAFLRAARSGDAAKLIEYLETHQVTDINTCNANGLNALHLAAKDGHVNIVTELLKRGAGVNNATKKGNTALHIASLAGQKEVIKILVHYAANVNVQSQNGFTPLYMAAQENHDACVRYLLSKGANQSVATEDGFTPMAVAMQQGHVKVVTVLLGSDMRVTLPALHIAAKKDDVTAAKLLLENDHNPDIASKSGFTPLHIAAHYGNTAISELLIATGASINYGAKHNITPLHVACKWGKTNMVDLLIERSAQINSNTHDGLTPLHCAARSGHEKVIELLIANGASILAKTKNGLAPLHMAAQGDHVNAANILLVNRVPVDEVTNDYLTALHVAAHCGHVNVTKLLLDRGADANARALNGFTPLHIACKKNRLKVVELLLKHGACIGSTTESGLTPLHVASFMGCMNIVIYLMQNDASADVPTVRGETPLHLAARANQTDIIRILLRNGAAVDACAREQQTPLHVASRLGNTDNVMLLIQHGANVNAATKDQYAAIHIAAKEGRPDVCAILVENGAQLDGVTKKGFTPLHLAAKYGRADIVAQLLKQNVQINMAAKNAITPLHVATHYDHSEIVNLLLENGASPHATAKNGHTPLHICARKNQLDNAVDLLRYGADVNAESKCGFRPIHLAAQLGHLDMCALLIDKGANATHAARNGLTPLHLAAQEDNVDVAQLLLRNGAVIDAPTKGGFTPLHIAAHNGQVTMVRYLIENDANIEMSTNIGGYTPLHQAAQQGHTLIINLLLKNKANPNALTNNGQTAYNLADKLGYITIVECLKIVTETVTPQQQGSSGHASPLPSSAASPSHLGAANDVTKMKMIVPEGMHETYMSDSEDEGEDPIMSDQAQYKYMTVNEMKSMGDDHIKLGSMREEKALVHEPLFRSLTAGRAVSDRPGGTPDNVDISRQPIHVGVPLVANSDSSSKLTFYGGDHSFKRATPMNRESFLVSFLVDARGGAMRGCRHSGVRVIVPPKSAAQPTRITCRYVKPNRLANLPPLMEGEALASRILELGPVGAKFLGPVIIEIPHFASMRNCEREIIILRSDNGETWREHTLFDSEEAIQDVLNECFEGDETIQQLEDLHTNRITRIVSNDFPHFFAIVSRIRQEVHAIGPDGGTVSSTAVPQVQAVFPPNALTKKIRVGLQAQPVDAIMAAELLGRSVAVSPVVTVEPRRRKFHKAITLSIPAPRASTQGMINQYSGNTPTLRLLCSITGGQNRAVWEDVTGSTPLTFVKDCVSFTTTVSARFWLMDCRQISDACKMATELYSHMVYVPFMAKFVVYARRTIEPAEAKLSVFCMTDDREDKTLEKQENYTEIAKSRDVEVLENRPLFVEFGGGQLIPPIHKSSDQLKIDFHAFKENRLNFAVRIAEQQQQSPQTQHDDSPTLVRSDGEEDEYNETPVGRIVFMTAPKVARGDAPQTPICILNLFMPEPVDRQNETNIIGGTDEVSSMFLVRPSNIIDSIEMKVQSQQQQPQRHTDGNAGDTDDDQSPLTNTIVGTIHKADIRLSDICQLLKSDWIQLGRELAVPETDLQLITSEYPNDVQTGEAAMVMLRLWLRTGGKKATGNVLEQALYAIKRPDIVGKCIFNVEIVTDDSERALAKRQLNEFENSIGRNDTKSSSDYITDMDTIDNSYLFNSDTINDHDDECDNSKRDIININNPDTIQLMSTKTPPPSPADFHISNPYTNAPTAIPELDLRAAIVANGSDSDDMRGEQEIEQKLTDFDNPLSVGGLTKIRTIKKHSRSQQSAQLDGRGIGGRNTVDNIEWSQPTSTQFSITSTTAPSITIKTVDDSNECQSNSSTPAITTNVIHELSTHQLDDVSSTINCHSTSPVILNEEDSNLANMIIKSSSDYGGETAKNVSAANVVCIVTDVTEDSVGTTLITDVTAEDADNCHLPKQQQQQQIKTISDTMTESQNTADYPYAIGAPLLRPQVSSSDSDVALHEAGTELSDDEAGTQAKLSAMAHGGGASTGGHLVDNINVHAIHSVPLNSTLIDLPDHENADAAARYRSGGGGSNDKTAPDDASVIAEMDRQTEPPQQPSASVAQQQSNKQPQQSQKNKKNKRRNK